MSLYSIEAFHSTMKHITEHFDEFDMESWGRKESVDKKSGVVAAADAECKTVACAAGHTLLASGNWTWDSVDDWADPNRQILRPANQIVPWNIKGIEYDQQLRLANMGQVAVAALEILVPGEWSDSKIWDARGWIYTEVFSNTCIKTVDELWNVIEYATNGEVTRPAEVV